MSHLDVEGEGEDGKSLVTVAVVMKKKMVKAKAKAKSPNIPKDDAKAIPDELKNAVIQAAQSVGAGNVPSKLHE